MIDVEPIGPGNIEDLQAAKGLFGEVFGDEGHQGPSPGDDHLRKLLADEKFIALVARIDGGLVGALAGYELVKFEAKRSEIYI